MILGYLIRLAFYVLPLWAYQYVVLQRWFTNWRHNRGATRVDNKVCSFASEALWIWVHRVMPALSVREIRCIVVSRDDQVLLVHMVEALLGIWNIWDIKLLTLVSSLTFRVLPASSASIHENTVLNIESLIEAPYISMLGIGVPYIGLAIASFVQDWHRPFVIGLSLVGIRNLILLIMNYWCLWIWCLSLLKLAAVGDVELLLLTTDGLVGVSSGHVTGGYGTLWPE